MKLTQSMSLNRQPERWSWWSTLLWSFGLFTLSPLVLYFILNLLWTVLSFITDIRFTQSTTYNLIMDMIDFPWVLLCVVFCQLWCYRHPLQGLGFTRSHFIRRYLIGSLLGAAMISLIYTCCRLLGVVTTASTDIHWYYIAVICFGFLIQGLTEEVVCRGFIMNKVSRQLGVPAGIGINSLFFAAMHLLNDHMQLLAFINLLLAGIIFSFIFYLSDSIWLTGAVHSLWNIALGVVFGCEVSGERLPYTLWTTESHDTLFSGGRFGLEGGLITTCICLLVILLLIYPLRKRGEI